MFNLKTFVNKITDRGGRESQPDSPGPPGGDDDVLSKQAAEGFLCPKCMKAFPTAEELQAHYHASHDSDDSVSYDSASASPGAGFYGLHQEVGERYKLSRQNGNSISQERLTAEIQGITDVGELQKSLLDALETKSQLQLEKETLEQQIILLARRNDEEQNSHMAMKERLEIVEAQLAHRESIDDAAVLRQELVLVQRAMDEMTQVREGERDALESELQQLKLKYQLDMEAAESSARNNVQQVLLVNADISEQLRRAESKFSALEFDLNVQNVEIEDLKRQLEDYRNQPVKTLEPEDHIKTQLYKAENQVKLLNEQISAQSKQVELNAAAVGSHKSVFASPQDGDETLLHRITDKETYIIQLTQELTRLTVENDSVDRTLLQQLSKEHEALRTLLDELSALAVHDTARLEAEAFQQKRQADALQQELHSKMQQLQVKESTLKQMTAELCVAEKLRAEIGDLFAGASVSEVAAELLQLRADKLNLETSVTKLGGVHESEKITNVELLKKIQQLTTEKDKIQTAFTSLEEKYKKLDTSYNDLSATLIQLQTEKASLETALAALRDEFNAVENTNFDLEKRIDQLTDKIQASDVDKKHEMNKYSDLEFQLQGTVEMISVKEGIIADLQNANQDQLHEYLDLEHQLNTAKSQILTLTAKLTTQESEIQALTVKQTSLETVIFEVEKMKAELEMEKRSLQVLAEQTAAAHQNELSALEESFNETLTTTQNRLTALQDVVSEQKIIFDKQFSEREASHLSDLANKDLEVKRAQAALDEVAGEKLALEALLQASQSEHKTLLEKYYTSCNEHDAQRRSIDDLRRRSDDLQSALHELGRENQILRLELEKLLGRKWTEDSDVACCQLCHKEFTLLVRKHHCRNCGQIFCNECSTKNAPVANNKRPVRVCDGCFNELAASGHSATQEYGAC